MQPYFQVKVNVCYKNGSLTLHVYKNMVYYYRPPSELQWKISPTETWYWRYDLITCLYIISQIKYVTFIFFCKNLKECSWLPIGGWQYTCNEVLQWTQLKSIKDLYEFNELLPLFYNPFIPTTTLPPKEDELYESVNFQQQRSSQPWMEFWKT